MSGFPMNVHQFGCKLENTSISIQRCVTHRAIDGDHIDNDGYH